MRLQSKDLFPEERKEFTGKWPIRLVVSSTEEYITYLLIYSRVKSRVLLLISLLYLELYESLPKQFSHLKYYFEEFYTNWECILVQDLILNKENKPKVRNKRLSFLWEYGLMTPMVKERAVLHIVGLEFRFLKQRERGHNTTYGWIKHFRDHGHLPPERPDYFPDSDELESNYVSIQDRIEKRSRIRKFLLQKGITKFEELFPEFRITPKKEEK